MTAPEQMRVDVREQVRQIALNAMQECVTIQWNGDNDAEIQGRHVAADQITTQVAALTRPATDELVEALEAMKKALEAIVCFDRIEPKGSHCDFEDSVPANDGRFAQIARTALRNTGAVS